MRIGEDELKMLNGREMEGEVRRRGRGKEERNKIREEGIG